MDYVFSPSKNHYEKGSNKPEVIVLHHTAGYFPTDLYRLEGKTGATVSCHWYINRKGVVYKLVDEDCGAWHAGYATYRGAKNVNRRSIGIEMENRGRSYDKYPLVQLNSLNRLISEIRSRHGKLPIVGHKDIDSRKPIDPHPKTFPLDNYKKYGTHQKPKPKPKKKPPQIKRGSTGYWVRVAQSALARKGFSPGPIDGDFGPLTQKAVKRFQRKAFKFRPWEWDGIIGPKTWEKLGY